MYELLIEHEKECPGNVIATPKPDGVIDLTCTTCEWWQHCTGGQLV